MTRRGAIPRSDGLSERTVNCLHNLVNGFMEAPKQIRPDAVAAFRRSEVRQFYAVGEKTFAEIVNWLGLFGLKLKE